MSRFFSRKLSALEPYTPGEQPKDMARLIKLNTNESPFPPSPRVIAAVNAQADSLQLYPDPSCAKLCAAIARRYGLAPEQVTVGNGSDEVLAFCFHGLCPRGAAFADMTYGFYPVFCDMFGVEKHVVPLREDYTLAVADYASEAGTVFLANPNAPTGLCLPLADIAALCRQNPDRLVVVDEAYVDFGGESAAALLGKYDNLLVVQTFSKSRQLAGGRLGFALGSRALIADLNALKFSFNPYSVNRLTLAAGIAAMEDTDYFDRCRALVMENRERLTAALRGLGFRVLDSKANFIFAGHPDFSGGDYYAALRRRGILVRYFPGGRTGAFVRITIGSGEQVDALIAATEEILKERA